MQKHSLNWSHAYTGRLSRAMLAKYDSTAALSARLEKEIHKLPFLTMSYREQLEEDMARIVPHCSQFDHMLLLGIGGSALGARALQKAFSPGQDCPCHDGKSLWIADNVCPITFESWLKKLPVEKTVVVCVSKSGGTIETIAQYLLVRAWLEEHLSHAWKDHVVLITDSEMGFLRQEVKKNALHSMEVPNFLGGRYSALSAVGLLPAAFLGIDWKALMDGAYAVAKPLVENPYAMSMHPSYRLATWALGLDATHYHELIFFSYIPTWATFGPWFVQLWAESLGKEGRGSMPIAATGVTDQHSVQQMFLDGPSNKACIFLTCPSLPQGRAFSDTLPEQWQWLQGQNFGQLLQAEALGTRMTLTKHALPLVHIDMQSTDEAAAGALMMLLEITTVLTGWLMDINPLDQPAVEMGKRYANARLGAPKHEQEKNALDAFINAPEERQEF